MKGSESKRALLSLIYLFFYFFSFGSKWHPCLRRQTKKVIARWTLFNNNDDEKSLEHRENVTTIISLSLKSLKLRVNNRFYPHPQLIPFLARFSFNQSTSHANLINPSALNEKARRYPHSEKFLMACMCVRNHVRKSLM